jgi:hypothetical protein
MHKTCVSSNLFLVRTWDKINIQQYSILQYYTRASTLEDNPRYNHLPTSALCYNQCYIQCYTPLGRHRRPFSPFPFLDDLLLDEPVLHELLLWGQWSQYLVRFIGATESVRVNGLVGSEELVGSIMMSTNHAALYRVGIQSLTHSGVASSSQINRGAFACLILGSKCLRC